MEFRFENLNKVYKFLKAEYDITLSKFELQEGLDSGYLFTEDRDFNFYYDEDTNEYVIEE